MPTAGQRILAAEGGTWIDYTPTLTNFTGTITTARYCTVGELIRVRVEIAVTGVSGNMTVSRPVTGSDTGSNTPLGTAMARDGSASEVYSGFCVSSGSSNIIVRRNAGTTAAVLWNATVPFTWAASSDTFWVEFSYEIP